MLLGSESDSYAGNGIYHLSADGAPDIYLYMLDAGFLFPTLSEEQFEYEGSYVDTYTGTVYTGSGEALCFISTANDDGISCTITGISGKKCGDLVIPEEIDGLTVTVIAEEAFRYCRGFDGELFIPDTVREIRQNAFFGCCNLCGALQLPSNLLRQPGRRCDSAEFLGILG